MKPALHPGHCGFSLIELAVVLAIFSVLAATAAPRLRQSQRGNEPLAAAITELRAARNRAVIGGTNVRIVIGTATFRFTPAGAAASDTLRINADGTPRRIFVDRWSGDVQVR